MEVFGMIGMTFGIIGFVGFILVIVLDKKVAKLEERIKELESK